MQFFLVFICLFAVASSIQTPWNKNNIEIDHHDEVKLDMADFLPEFLEEGRRGLTEEIWAWRKANLLQNETSEYTIAYNKRNGNSKRQFTCRGEGNCDTPSVRESTSMSSTIIIPCRWVVFSTSPGVYPISDSEIIAQMASIRLDYLPFNIDIQLLPGTSGIYHVYDSRFANIPAYSQINSQWYSTILQEKSLYAANPSTTFNIFVNRQTSGTSGTLLGFATFPWDSIALTNTGGIWMNALAIGGTKKTLNHEIGHNLGLWHTFHGVTEVTQCGSCYENPGLENSASGDLVGDFCADTPPTPMNYNCAPPGGFSPCTSQPWGTTMYTNIMGYGPDSCIRELTDCQEQRMICWMCATYGGTFSGC